jgi:hypothetical protein
MRTVLTKSKMSQSDLEKMIGRLTDRYGTFFD